MKVIGFTHKPHSSSFLGLSYRILNMSPNKELLWGLWVGVRIESFRVRVSGRGMLRA